MKKKDALNSPLTAEEQAFAAENYGLIKKYLNIRKLPYDDWHDIVVFRYLRSVKRWFAIPELHKYSFESVAFYAMRSAIGNERKKQKRRIQTVSLDDVIPDTDGITYADTVTYENLNYINFEGGEDMNIKYDVKLPEKAVKHGKKCDEVIAIEAFLKMRDKKNMCFEYEAEDEAKKKRGTIQSYRRREGHKEIYDVYRVEKCVYIVRLKAQSSIP